MIARERGVGVVGGGLETTRAPLDEGDERHVP